MATKTKKPKDPIEENKPEDMNKSGLKGNAWIPYRQGVIVIAVLSIGMAILTTYQALEVKPLGEAILYGLFFGGSLWLIFFGMILVNRFLGRH